MVRSNDAWCPAWGWWVPLGVAMLAIMPVAAQPVQCHVAWAGAARSFVVAPSAPDDPVQPLLEGASIALEIVNRLPPAPGAGVTVRTLGRWQGQTYLLHEAHYLPGSPTVAPHGFTGLQVVREPTRGHALSYWCERTAAVSAAADPTAAAR
ncbi:hypothetical protein [Tepidimonas aquatica]|uniref:Uncharacterized protein n=1 Tax=Tepidimonas aquatica TaxID=247482 RepID=A0A554WWB8_9BURK|nr:hypothetical protein [Tepidimonas aquatica]TSE27869.1 hypothetical protein Taqua_00064 [Tepidimonas aquatica]